MTAAERALSAVLGYLHPVEWRRSLRRQIDELVKSQSQARVDSRAAVLAERASAAHREGLLTEAAAVLAGSGHRFSPGQTSLLLRGLPVDESGALDEAAFAVRAFEEAASYAAVAGPAVRAARNEEG